MKVVGIVCVCITAYSCSGSSKSSGYSSVTGWKYNDPTGTGFTVNPNLKQQVPPGMVAIEGGSYTIGERNEYVTTSRNNQRRRITVRSFYMDQYEIRTVDWREYTTWMQTVFGQAAPSLVRKAMPDGTVWREELAYNEPYILHYFTHPAFDQYPVVGVTWEQASDYCIWRTDRVNEMALVKAGIILPPDFISLKTETNLETIAENFVFNTQKYLLQNSYHPPMGTKTKLDIYSDARKVDMSDGILFPEFRLPTEAEWEFAAYGVKVTDGSEIIEENKIYPWRGAQTRKALSKNQGQFLANFVRGRGDMMGTSGALNDGATLTAPVDWYYPNEFGLYNMAGNVNEWILDVYRSTSFSDMAEYNSFRGNVYTQPVRQGEAPEGYIIYEIDSLGRIKKAPVTDGDKRSFKDGDLMSEIDTEIKLYPATSSSNALRLYSDSTDITYLESLAESRIDPTDVLAPKITDKSRVYKGGSWKDRIYWLAPSSRRYLDQDKATNDIGFRCAMSMIGESDI